MPHGYEMIRNQILREGIKEKGSKRKRKVSKEKAMEIAARIWNDKHPENPVGRGT